MSTNNISEQVAALGRQSVSFEGIEVIPEEIRQLLRNNWGHPEVRQYFLENSEVCRILFKNPADFEMLEIAYFGKSVRGEISDLDKWFYSRLSGQALRDRLRAVSDWAVDWLKGHSERRVLDLGAGPGIYAIETVKKFSGINGAADGIEWRCVDIDRLALAVGEKRVAKQKLDHIISFDEVNFMSRDSYPQSPDEAFDFGLMIGILCGMTCEDAVKCLRRIIPHFRRNGEIMAATLLTRSFEEDPQSFRTYCNVIGWQLRPKTVQEVEGVFQSAGWEILNISSEREGGNGQYAVVHAKLA